MTLVLLLLIILFLIFVLILILILIFILIFVLLRADLQFVNLGLTAHQYRLNRFAQ
jgi:hypothetical protein